MRKRLIQKYHQNVPKGVKKFVKLSTLKKLKIAYIPYNELFKEGIFAGLGWAVGVTIGFAVISSVLVIILRQLGGLPVIGNWIASIFQETQLQLLKRTPIIPQ
ncbi:hypothetical protein A2686_02425 [Candidatus Woesebacteria bacterium RIFCSPHIGHO2_01_FULL_38_10]|uniref:Uncharacterized protein n=1 Tax=Candidatus Woesebacteria bacterium RIFCSPLOWO2_01_FULL_39_10b TaxID=1802517 RepID=A0A1F8B8P8_9BACT|nr:MAG: hypothetical protein A2686_02425 [Candidatus Woesebacteria bacterium RIFCSPHIGHO2_01_FULL_38_10]OGM60424.1 MAG: hypothetical protein A2892_00115 [Candidatus Woesebacteria bacterium RIFCSPLOWO2_01_FULL_39_10b]